MKTVLCKNENCNNLITVGDLFIDEPIECEQCHKNRKETFTERMLSDDICNNKHQQNPLSREANKRVHKEKDRNFILNYIIKNGTASSKELARVMNKGLNCISGRFSELRSDNLIIDTGLRKENCAVYKANNIQEKGELA